jgi:hypothetical protein
VLASQNPVDLDYKGLSNTGTWLLGRLQTERDKARVLDGLEGASSANFDRAQTERLLSGLDSRVFLMNNVHEDEPVLLHARWALSYLGGPLTRDQIRTLMAERKNAAAAPSGAVRAIAPEPAGAERSSTRPILPPDVPQGYLMATQLNVTDRLVYRPALFARATLHYVNARAEVDEWAERDLLVSLTEEVGPRLWQESDTLEAGRVSLSDEPEAGAHYADLPDGIEKASNYKRWQKMLVSHLYATAKLPLWKCKKLKLTSRPGEDEGAFRIRVDQQIRELRDLQVEKLRARYAPKLARVQEQIRTAEIRVEKEKDQKKQHGLSTAINVGATVLGAMFGRKLASSASVGRAGSALRSAGRMQRESGDIQYAIEKVQALEEKLDALDAEFNEKVETVRSDHEPEDFTLDLVEIAPRKSDLAVDQLVLAWVPYRVDETGIAEEAF